MTKDIVSKIIKRHYDFLSLAIAWDAECTLTRKSIKELHGITILAYFYLTGEELPAEPYKESNNEGTN